jgi:hypothetical protein
MPPPEKTSRVPDSVNSTWVVLVAYVKQETLGPLRGIGKRVGLGMVGALVAGIGAIELVLALLRALQEETGSTFTGSWSWAPYLITLVVVVLATAICLKIIDGRRDAA